MKNLVFTLVIVSLFSSTIYSQRSPFEVQVEYLKQFKFDKTTKFEDIDLATLKYIGSPYYNDDFLAGEIYFKNKLIADNIPLRYNALMDEIEFKPSFEAPDEESSALMKSPEVDVRIGNVVFIFAPYQGGIEKGGYFEVLLRSDKIDLFKKYNKKFTPEKKAITSMTKDFPAKFSDSPVYFLVLSDGRFLEISNKSRHFSKAFIGKEKEISGYIKNKDLDIRNEKHIIQIVEYYNSL